MFRSGRGVSQVTDYCEATSPLALARGELTNLKFEFAEGYNEPLRKWCDYKEKIGQPLSQESLNELYEHINGVILKDYKEEDRPKELEKAVNYLIEHNLY